MTIFISINLKITFLTLNFAVFTSPVTHISSNSTISFNQLFRVFLIGSEKHLLMARGKLEEVPPIAFLVDKITVYINF